MSPAADTTRRLRWRQGATVFRLELGRVLLSRRRLWVYVLALAPVLLIALFATRQRIDANQRETLSAATRPGLTAAAFASIQPGMSEAEVLHRLGPAPQRDQFNLRRRGPRDQITYADFTRLHYGAGGVEYTISLLRHVVRDTSRSQGQSLSDEQLVLGTLFQFFTIRLVVFFGCLGIFMNLFRGELLDRSLHFYFLAPVRREVVMAGKFAAGLAGAVVIFVGSMVLQLALLGWQIGPSARAEFLAVNHGWAQIGAYLGVTVLGCIGYGAFFLAAGMLTKNPIVPAAALLIWESINPFLPSLLRHISVIYYLTALAPVTAASQPGTPALIALLASGPGAIEPVWAVLGLLAVAAVLVWLAGLRVRRLEIDYSSE